MAADEFPAVRESEARIQQGYSLVSWMNYAESFMLELHGHIHLRVRGCDRPEHVTIELITNIIAHWLSSCRHSLLARPNLRGALLGHNRCDINLQ
jgi:hypothetical protein